MRPYRIGTSSGTRVVAWRSSNAIGSARSAAGAHSPWLARGRRLGRPCRERLVP